MFNQINANKLQIMTQCTYNKRLSFISSDIVGKHFTQESKPSVSLTQVYHNHQHH